jgi:hypothetical protein
MRACPLASDSEVAEIRDLASRLTVAKRWTRDDPVCIMESARRIFIAEAPARACIDEAPRQVSP